MKKCKICGKKFNRKYFESYKYFKSKKFCSSKCANKFTGNLKKDAFKGKHHSREWKEKQRQWMLKNNPFKGKKHSKETLENFKFRKRLRDKNHYNWKGGITELRKRIRACFKYRQWRADVFRKDNWTCQECGLKKRKIEADHHAISFANILREYDIKTLEEALECEKLWDINNGRTVCGDCHEKKHKCLRNLKNRNFTNFPEI